LCVAQQKKPDQATPWSGSGNGASECELQGELNQARIVDRICDYAEIGVVRRAAGCVGRAKLRAIEKFVAEFSPEFDIHVLVRAESCLLEDCKIKIVDP
jgi:hypothetical protein